MHHFTDSVICGFNFLTRYSQYLAANNRRDAKTSKKRFFVCSQDKELRAVLGSMAGFPLLYLNQVTLVMELPSQNSVEQNKEIEAQKMTINEEEKTILESLGISTTAAPEAPPVSKERKKRKATAPNPLSLLPASEESNRSKRRKLEKMKKVRKNKPS